MPRNYVLRGALFGCLLGAAACYPGEIDSAAQTDLVVTFHDDAADFQANATFAIPDSIVDVGVAGGGSSTLDHTYDTQILQKIANEMKSAGYDTVAAAGRPDVVVVVSAITVENYYYYTPGYPWYPYWGWWGGWPAGYGASSNWYYPWYPVYSTNFTSGTIFITMIDPDVPPPEAGDAVSIWSAALNGMLEGTNTEILSRISNNISQAFAQSPYLNVP
jgi:uncharacterized protein DUF4136